MSNVTDLPKSTIREVKSREVRTDTTDEANLLSAVGEKLRPEGLTYLGAMCSHVYRNPLSGEYFTLSQATDLRKIPEKVAQHGVRELVRAVLTKFGHMPPAKRGDVKETFV
jgi:hypothetical protein